MIASWQESDDKSRQCVEKKRCYPADKGPYIEAMVFPLVRYDCESWTVKKAKELTSSNCDAGQQGDQTSPS